MSQMKAFASNMADAFRGFFDIESPSKLIIEYGGRMVEGLTMGLEPMADTMIGTENAIGDTFKTSSKSDMTVNLALPSGIVTMDMISDILAENNMNFLNELTGSLS